MERGVIVNQKRIFELGASTKRSPTGMGAVDRFGVGVLCVLAGFALLMLIAPSAIIIAISFTEKAYIGFPPSGNQVDGLPPALSQRLPTGTVHIIPS